MKNLIRKILKEETSNKFIEKVVNYVKAPYFKNMEGLGLSEDEYEMVLSRIFDQKVRVIDGVLYDVNDKVIYEEDGDYWIKSEYNKQGKKIYEEHSNDFWVRVEYDDQGNRIYQIDSKGFIIDNR